MKRINLIGLAALGCSWALLAEPLPAQFVYVANYNGANISAYSLNPKTGVLAAVPGSPFATGTTPASLALHPSGRFLYVTNTGPNTVSGYSIDDKTGALTAIPGQLPTRRCRQPELPLTRWGASPM
jgi:6-phosphogluconolactonase (cycloisomerase 2 family)